MFKSAKSWMRRSVVGLLPCGSVFETRLIYVGELFDIVIVVDRVFPD